MPITIQPTTLKWKDEQGVWHTSDCLKGDKGDPGQTGASGQDGHSPVLTSSKSGKTTTIYSDGSQLAQVVDGADADPTTIIDDTSTAENKVWSADKTNSLLSALNVLEPDATASDVGKMLRVKTVADGKVTEYEFGAGGGGSTSILIAASNSDIAIKEQADYVCTGTNDQTTINAALSSLTKGEICLLAGDYYISGEINPVSNVDIRGFGHPVLHLTNRIITTLSQNISINDETIYLTDPTHFIVGQKIAIKYGSNDNEMDYEVGHIKTIDYETGAVTMYKRAQGSASEDFKTTIGKVSHAANAGAYVITDPCVIMGWYVDNVTISELSIDGNSSNLSGYTSDTDYGANLIEFRGGSNIRIIKNNLTNCYKHSVLFVYGTEKSFVCENIIDTAVTHGIDFYTDVNNNLVYGNVLKSANIQTHGGLKNIISSNILVGGSLMNTGGAYNIFVGNRIDLTGITNRRCSSFSGSGAQYCQILGNVFMGGTQGIQLDTNSSIKISGNKFISNRSNAIHLYKTTECVVINNTIDSCNAAINEAAIKIENASVRNTVSCNTIYGTMNKTTNGVNEVGSSADYNVIANNTIFKATTGVTKTGTHSVEQNNVVVS